MTSTGHTKTSDDEALADDLEIRERVWHKPVKNLYPAKWLDDRAYMRWAGVDPDEFIGRIRRELDENYRARRGLVFCGEEREGDEIARYYLRPTIWRRIRLALFRRWMECRPLLSAGGSAR